MIPSEPTMMRMIAWLMRSELTTGPMVVRLACSSIGPSSASRATTISAILPVVGRSVFPPAAGGLGGPGDPDGEAAGDADGLADGDADGLAGAEAPGEPDGPGLPLAVGDAVGDGAGARPIGSVLIWMNPLLVEMATAS